MSSEFKTYNLKKKAAGFSEIKHLCTRMRRVKISDPLQPSKQKCENEPQNSKSCATHSKLYPSYDLTFFSDQKLAQHPNCLC
jgi:hypothetical protein